MHQPGKPWKDRSLQWRLRRTLHFFRTCIPINIMTFIHSGPPIYETHFSWRFININDFLRQVPVINEFRTGLTLALWHPQRPRPACETSQDVIGHCRHGPCFCLLANSSTKDCAPCINFHQRWISFSRYKPHSALPHPNCSAPKANYKVQTTEYRHNARKKYQASIINKCRSTTALLH